MSLMSERFAQKERMERQISQKVANEYIKPTEQEQEQTYDIIRKVSSRFADRMLSDDIEKLNDEIKAAVAAECSLLHISFEEQKRIEKMVVSTVLGHGPIDELLKDPSVTDIIVQRYDNIVVERNGRIEKVGAVFNNEEHLRLIIERIVQKVGRSINMMAPIVDARLEDGSRVNATIPPVSPDGATLAIRKFNQRVMSGQDYIHGGSISREMLYFLERCVRGRLSIFVSGGTGSGKTSLLNMLSLYIPDDELIVTIEDTLELKLQQSNIRRMETRTPLLENNANGMMSVDQKMLVKAALRQRPDRIILGEARDGSIVDLISAMSTGHEGSMSTVHANNPRNLCDVRIPILYSMNKEADFSEKSIALQIAEAVNIIVQIRRMPDGSRKITHISQVDGVRKDGKVCLRDIFLYDTASEQFVFTGYYPEVVINKIREHGWDFNDEIFPPSYPHSRQEGDCT